ncbi:hypothetical protein [Thiolapillus brandeum]|uniref:Uncharacterized protein n=1 Tax=Thiolapillus brandeum TaxID=1076588 RepID=A0A7U6GIR8_9GAMM|nr:hypothetical protein [Thiolapillus brandeum]BAO44345.1 hypothetical protein TBH_C1422 [Thiolapillus brandeum]
MQKSMRKLWLLLVICLMPGLLPASSIKRADMTEITRDSQLVFEGRVIGTRVEQLPGERSLHTWVRFEILDVIKGSYNKPFIELSFLGGTRGDLTVKVSDMQIPHMGEHGIYFVEDTGRRLVNPLVGWSQGHFLVKYDRKLKRQTITTLDGQVVRDIDTTARKSNMAELSHGIAYGVITRGGAEKSSIGPEDFKSLIRGMAQ